MSANPNEKKKKLKTAEITKDDTTSLCLSAIMKSRIRAYLGSLASKWRCCGLNLKQGSAGGVGPFCCNKILIEPEHL